MGFDLTGLGSLADLAKRLVDRFLPPAATETERLAAQVQIQQMLGARESAMLEAQKAIMVAELQQDDPYTKRTRPMLVRWGLYAIGIVHVALPTVSWLTALYTDQPLQLPQIALPQEFWLAWGGVVSVYALGRSLEKAGMGNPIIKKITGAK